MSTEDRQHLLQQAVQDLLEPLARLCVGRGLPFAQAEELFKRAYVAAAREARREQGQASERDVSQVAVATGLHRREVTRIGDAEPRRAVQRPAPATQLVTRWLADPTLRHKNGRIRRLPRQASPDGGPSFEALAASITRHVHPRSLLDELLRRGLVAQRGSDDTVELLSDRIAPTEDEARLFTFLGANAGDHLSAAVANVLHGDRRHVEQAVFSDSMSTHGVAQARALVQQQWQVLLQNLVPALQQMIDDDRQAGRVADHRLRVGLYSFHEPLPEETDEPEN
jgi:hypothetical protein